MLVLDLAAPICVVSSEILWHFEKWLAWFLWNECMGSWRAGWGQVKESVQIFDSSVEIQGSPGYPFCSPLPLAALPLVLHCCRLPARRQGAGVYCRKGWLFPGSPRNGAAKCSRAFFLLPAVCHSMQETTLTIRSAFLGSSISSESLS